MADHPPSTYPEVILTYRRLFGEHKAQFERSTKFLRTCGLKDIFKRHPDVDALAYQISVNPCSEEVNNEFAGVIVAGELNDTHPANTEGKLLFDAVEAASDDLWAAECYEVAVLARRAGDDVEITEHDPRSLPASRLLDMVEDGQSTPNGREPDADDRDTNRAGMIVLTRADVADLALGGSINVPLGAGPCPDLEVIVDGLRFDDDAIAALQNGDPCEIEGVSYVAEKPTPPAKDDEEEEEEEEPTGGR